MNSKPSRVLIIGADGLRPDLLDSHHDLLPNYHQLLRRGTRFSQCTASYPSSTRVNIATLTTGVEAGMHGIIDNLLHIPGFNHDGRLQTGNHQQILEFARQFGRPLLLRPTLGDRLHEYGGRLGVVTSSSPGAALLWNLNHPQLVINTSACFGQDSHRNRQPGPEAIKPEIPGTKRNQSEWATRVLVEQYLPNPDFQVMVLWLSEPDASLHHFTAGSPEVAETLRLIDSWVGRILAAISQANLADKLNLLLLSDHGHSTLQPVDPLVDLIDKAVIELAIATPLIVLGHHIFTDDHRPLPKAEGTRLINWLYQQPDCDLLFTAQPDLLDLPGILPLSLLYGRIEHDRVPCIAVCPAWSEALNAFGVRGWAKPFAKTQSLSSHGTLSPYDMHTLCLGCGPAFLEGAVSERPCGLVDIAPTVCHLAGLHQEQGFTGRVLTEGLKFPTLNSPAPIIHQITSPAPAGSQKNPITRGLRISRLNGHRYLRGSGPVPTPRLPDWQEKSSIRAIAHRGASSYAPENTIAAFDVARAMGVEDIELDIHLSYDGEIVVIHDSRVDRTTDGNGLVNELTLDQLQELDAGSWFSQCFSGQRIPSLRTILERYAGDFRFHIELKGSNPELASQAAILVAELELEEAILFTSFRTEALEQAAAAAPQIPRGWLVREWPETRFREARHLELTQICPAASALDSERVEKWHRAGYQVRAYGVKTVELMQAAITAGVDGMTINFPDLLLAALNRDPFKPII